jgi:hypothetical protein
VPARVIHGNLVHQDGTPAETGFMFESIQASGAIALLATAASSASALQSANKTARHPGPFEHKSLHHIDCTYHVELKI